MKQMYSIFLVMMMISFSWGQKKYSVPNKTHTHLFYVQHSQGINTFVYDVNVKNNAIVKDNPVLVKRINYEERGKIEDLNGPQKKLAYGIKSFNQINDSRFNFTIAAYKNQNFVLTQNDSGYSVETIVNHKKIRLDKMFIQLKDSNIPLGFKVNYVLFYGTEIATGKSIVEKLILKD